MSIKIHYTTDLIGGNNEEEIKRIRVVNSPRLRQVQKTAESNQKQVIAELNQLNKYKITVHDSCNYLG